MVEQETPAQDRGSILGNPVMTDTTHVPADAEDIGDPRKVTEIEREEALLKTGALQKAIFNSANFSSIATDAKGVIQIFNVGADLRQ